MSSTKRLAAFARSALAAVCVATSSLAAQEEDKGFEEFSGYRDAPAFSVVPRKQELTFYPCSQCHEFMEPNATVRELMSPHEIELTHGRGRFWCYSCHRMDDRDQLRTGGDKPVDFDDAHLVCGGCHGLRHKDWHFGAHGKRQTDFHDDRVIYNCTHCHDAHDPVIEPREPMPAPGVRGGLDRPLPQPHRPPRVWERHAEETTPEIQND